MEGSSEGNIMFYGHLDKQPAMKSLWDEDKHPYEPLVKDGRLYGRGSSNGAVSFVTAILTIKALQLANLKHKNFSLVFETN